MKIKFLGIGSAFSNKYRNTSILINHNNFNLLFDCGYDIKRSLFVNGLSPKDIDMIFISHLHSDHVGGLEYIAQYTYYGKLPKINLLSHNNILFSIWNKTLTGGLCLDSQSDIRTYFDIHKYLLSDSFYNMNFKFIKTNHVPNMDSYALSLENHENKKKILFTGDSNMFSEEVYENHDLIIHDCETNFCQSGVHARYEDLVKLPKDIREKIILTHFNDNIEEFRMRLEDLGFRLSTEDGEMVI